MTVFRRGFKSWCETTSAQFRIALGLVATAPLPASRLARHVGAAVVALDRIQALRDSARRQLTSVDPGSWSAVTVSDGNRHVVVLNPTHSSARQSNDLMHECAHLILNHKPAQAVLSPDGQLLVSAYDRRQEDEANWLAGTLLLPRTALVAISQARFPLPESAARYGVSESLLAMRLNTTGVARQFGGAPSGSGPFGP